LTVLRYFSLVGVGKVQAIDAFEFAQSASQVSGEVAIASLTRFSEGLPKQAIGEAGLLQWSARGERDRHGRFFLHLHLSGAPIVQCQRCLAPFAWPVDSGVTLELVRTQSELDGDAQEEADLDAPEKVLGSRRFDLLAHIEDELILVVPTIARHPVCPALPEALEQQDFPVGTRRASPFAALESLKTKQ